MHVQFKHISYNFEEFLKFRRNYPQFNSEKFKHQIKENYTKTEQYFFDHFNQPYRETDSFQPIAQVMIGCLIIHHLKKGNLEEGKEIDDRRKFDETSSYYSVLTNEAIKCKNTEASTHFFNLLEDGRRKTALVVPIIRLMFKQNQLAPLINFLESLDETLTNNRHIKKKFNKNLAIGIKGSKNVPSDYLNSIASHINDETKKDQILKWISDNKKKQSKRMSEVRRERQRCTIS